MYIKYYLQPNYMENLVRKKTRQRLQQKSKQAKSSGTLAGQVSRTKAAKGYKTKTKKSINVNI
jgi:hypothetical protein